MGKFTPPTRSYGDRARCLEPRHLKRVLGYCDVYEQYTDVPDLEAVFRKVAAWVLDSVAQQCVRDEQVRREIAVVRLLCLETDADFAAAATKMAEESCPDDNPSMAKHFARETARDVCKLFADLKQEKFRDYGQGFAGIIMWASNAHFRVNAPTTAGASQEAYGAAYVAEKTFKKSVGEQLLAICRESSS